MSTIKTLTLYCFPSLQLTKESTVVLAKGSAPNVKLDDKFYKLVDKMEARPLVACSSLCQMSS